MSLEVRREAIDVAISATTQALELVQLEAKGAVDLDEVARVSALIGRLKTQLYTLEDVRQDLFAAGVSVLSLSPSEILELQSLTLRLDSYITGGAINPEAVLYSTAQVRSLAAIGTDSTGPKVQE